MGRKQGVYLNDDEAGAMDVVMAAHDLRKSVTAVADGIGQAVLESLLAKGVLQSPDGLRFAVVQNDL